ncbi:MAG: acyltransferase domain-containing protein [Planctomycetes bacterium]|nr:acyltransferase domain-containing protein [Planctomycetota bacterium]
MPATLTEPQPVSAPPASGWDTEVFVLGAPDRAALRARAVELLAQIDAAPVALPELAAVLAARLAPGGARLAVVAGSHADLRARLARAADRLADPKFKQVRDSNGLYYFDEPLGARGTVALLFPGEGAQYLNMLLDLCAVFPEVEDTFLWCDRLAEEAGRPEASLRRVLHPPPGTTAEERAAIEAELRGLGPSIFGVLLADQAIFRVLEGLRVPAAAIAGHSAGELGALLASGAMDSRESHGSRLPEIMDIMQRQESAVGGPEIALLAVGASKATIEDVARAVADGAVVVAMDNCPHQCVAVGPTDAVAAVERALGERGVIAERLPFKRPYHTPMFEPYMGALRALFTDVPFNPPHTPVYCCTTARLFPTDPAAMRHLAVDQWVTPVEFTRTIERMHADGARLFVECGPRGNLSAFVEDILRGKPFAAIPANVPRKSGPTQINHMVAQLVAHGVDLNLAYLYEGRTSGRTRSASDGVSVDTPSRSDAHPVAHTPGSPASVVHTYLDVMEQFLDAQREVMSAYFGAPVAYAPGAPASGASPASVADLIEAGAWGNVAAPAPTRPATEEKPYALIETVVHHAPGQELVFRRVMDEREDLYADDHTLGGRGVSRENPAQNGLPVLPMTFSLEAMSEAASALAPGKVVTAVRNVRLFRWLPFDPGTTTLEVRARVVAVDPETGAVEVKADVRDLGNSFLSDGTNKPACEATVDLADRYPDAPGPLPFALTDEVACKSSVEDLRRNMFHGPLFQMIRSLDRTGREGIDGTLEVQPRDGWFRSNADPRIAIDPVLTDAAMHILGAWHLEQPDWTGRILLPIGVKSLEFFGPPPPAGTRFFVRGHNEHEDARQVRHGVELFDADGRVWMRLVGAGYWRFYLPFGHVNFFGPKDEYFLSRGVPDAVGANGAHARCHLLEPPADLKQPVLRAAGARVTMTPHELGTFNNWTGTDAELNDWFFGRMLAKDAVRAAWNAKHGEAMFPADMESEAAGARIVCRPRGAAKGEPLPPVRVAIADGKVAALAAFAPTLGIGLQGLAKNAAPDAERAARAATACAAVADALDLPAARCELVSLDATGAAVVSADGARYRVQTARQADTVVATTLCEPA